MVDRIPLAKNTIGPDEMTAVGEVLVSGNLTQGAKVAQFEEVFHEFLNLPGDMACSMVNSGSSANLLAAAALAARVAKDPRRREVITPALTWSTTVAPLIQHGFKPVFVDVGPDYCMDTGAFEDAITGDTVAVMPVHLLGNPCDMRRVTEIADDYGLFVVEDCCEALGARWQGERVGTWGTYASFSFFFSHHLSTIEGGMLVHYRRDHRVSAFREHGWTRRYPEDLRAHEGIDPLFCFDQLGYNVRSTEVNAAIGIVQLEKQDEWMLRRQAIADTLHRAAEKAAMRFEGRHVPLGAQPNPFNFPLMLVRGSRVTDRDIVRGVFEERGVETRPVMSGDITRHPWFQRNKDKYGVSGRLDTTKDIHQFGFLVPCYPTLTDEEVDRIAETILIVGDEQKGA